MTFYVGQNYTQDFDVGQINTALFSGITARWVFVFATGTTKQVDTSTVFEEDDSLIASFTLEPNHFEAADIGPVQWQVILTDADGRPRLYSRKYDDMLERGLGD